MSEDMIRYDVLTQEALRQVIRKVLEEVSIAGLPGDHHFFITIDTTAPGVRLSKRMRERYPESITIVIQHSFWNLEVGETGFEVDLSFNDIRERLKVPYAAIQAFFDPSVKFGLQFEAGLAQETGDDQQNEEGMIGNDVDLIELSADADPADNEADATASEDEDKKGEVVSLDAFRKNK